MNSQKTFLQDIRGFSLETCAALHQEIFGKNRWSTKSFQELLTLKTTFGKVLCTPEKGLIGFYLGQHVCESCELLTILVEKEQRKQGVGKFLLEIFMEESFEKGVYKIFLEVGKDNKTAISLYSKIGFRPIGIRHKYYEQIDSFSGDALTFCFSF